MSTNGPEVVTHGTMRCVYIAGKFRAPTQWEIEQNIRKAEELGLEVARLGCSPLIPHANTRSFHGVLPDSFWLEATLTLLERCDAVVLVDGWEESEGARGEVNRAIDLGIVVFTTIYGLKCWLEGQAPK